MSYECCERKPPKLPEDGGRLYERSVQVPPFPVPSPERYVYFQKLCHSVLLPPITRSPAFGVSPTKYTTLSFDGAGPITTRLYAPGQSGGVMSAQLMPSG